MLGGALPSGSLGGLQEGRPYPDGALDGTVLIRLQDPGADEALEGEIESEGGIGEGEERLQEAVHGGGVRRNPRAVGCERVAGTGTLGDEGGGGG